MTPSTTDEPTASSEDKDAPVHGAQNDRLGQNEGDRGGDGVQAPTNSELIRRSSTASGISFDESPHSTKCNGCTVFGWSKHRKAIATFGCMSSILVCAIRLKIDSGYQTYTIHSIIVFFDMILIHLFTATKWLVSRIIGCKYLPLLSSHEFFAKSFATNDHYNICSQLLENR